MHIYIYIYIYVTQYVNSNFKSRQSIDNLPSYVRLSPGKEAL